MEAELRQTEPENTRWSACGRQLLKDGRSFFVRGVNYAPTPIGRPGRLDMLGETAIFLRDLQNLRLMNANAVKTYDFYSSVDHAPYLDAAFNAGVDPVFTVFSIWIDQTLMDPSVLEDSDEFQSLVDEYYSMARQTGGHPGVLGYSIGGEMNSITVIHDPSFWRKFQALTSAVRRGLKANNDAQKIITTTFIDDGGATFAAGEAAHADVDMWGSNVYQTDYPGSVIPMFLAVPGGKPLLVSEYGFPYASDKGIGDTMQLNLVADLLTQQTLAMQNNFERKDVLQQQAVVGGFVFEYSDEWWKAGNPDEHNLGLVKNGQFPLGFLSEEFFGLYSASRGVDDGTGTAHDSKLLPDVMKARPTVSLLANIWGNGSLETEGDVVVDCNATPLASPAAKGVTAGSSRNTTSGVAFESIMVLGLVGAVLVFLLAAYRTRSRRAQYHSLSASRSSTSPSTRAAPRSQPSRASKASSLQSHDDAEVAV
ncbi:hypothetical protein BBJ28_00021780 [Nothophytophthora sp. Chile5]|nr:hypothetical protein BBJ28_00021780 [Nothophytophthora sp. Chile5]